MARDDPDTPGYRISAGQRSGLPERSYRPIGSHESWQWDMEAQRQSGSRLPFAGDEAEPEAYRRFRVGDHPSLLRGMDTVGSSATVEEGRGPGLRRSLRGRTRGPFRGRSPKNYRRSDDRLREQVCERLTEDHDLDASDIEVEVRDQEVTLSGTVDSRAAKFHAEELVERCGVHEIHNRLRVPRPQTPGRHGP